MMDHIDGGVKDSKELGFFYITFIDIFSVKITQQIVIQGKRH